jgi:hypothetical protein
VPHNVHQTELSVKIEDFSERVSKEEVVLIESYLGDLIQAVLLTQDEDR